MSREAERSTSRDYLSSALIAGRKIRDNLLTEAPNELLAALETTQERIATLSQLLVSAVRQRELELKHDAIQMAESQGLASSTIRASVVEALDRIDGTMKELQEADVFALDEVLGSTRTTSSLQEAADLVHFEVFDLVDIPGDAPCAALCVRVTYLCATR
jgi:hypothetical protein